MPRSSKDASKVKYSPDKTTGWLGFVDIAQSAEELAEMRERYPSEAQDLMLCLVQLVQAGYKVTFGNPHEGASFTASATGKGSENPNNGYTCSAFGMTPEKALWALYWKVAITAEWGVWANFAIDKVFGDRWG